MTLMTAIRLGITVIQAPVNYVRGRYFPMYDRPRKLLATHVSQLLGTLFLQTPIYTEEDEARERQKPLAQRSLVGVGPVRGYMKDEFFYAKANRTILTDQVHFRQKLLLAEYSNRAMKTIAWRCFVFGALFCAGVVVAANTVAWSINKSVSIEHKVSNGVAGLVHDSNAPTVHYDDNTDQVMAPDLAQAFKDALASGVTLTADQQHTIVDDLTSCPVVMADIVTNGNLVRTSLAQAKIKHEDFRPVALAKKIPVCRSNGYYDTTALMRAMMPLRQQVSPATWLMLNKGAVNNPEVDNFSADERSRLTGNFDTCAADIVRIPSLSNHSVQSLSLHDATFLVRRYQACGDHGQSPVIPAAASTRPQSFIQ
ncbi:MAG TPA: hypothetical protein VMB73_18270 [Acetobacteraceae bacterium]|nr:hypothetical protein [Acetobacteraceae bacterium]